MFAARTFIHSALIYCALAAFAATPAAAASFETILAGTAKLGLRQPNGPLALDASGAVYGAASYGGTRQTYRNGAIFRLSPPQAGQSAWTPETIYNFTGSDFLPLGVEFLDNSGVLYGTSDHTIFTLAPSTAGGAWIFTPIYRFGGADGYAPASLVTDGAGNIYGANPFGDTNNQGRIFELSPPAGGQGAWTHKVLHFFTPSEGRLPGDLLADPATGTLYGVLNDTGTATFGAVFALAPPAAGQTVWHLKILHRFTGADGKYPNGNLLRDSNGALYGTLSSGGPNGFGQIFQLAPPSEAGKPWQLRVLHDFAGGADGSYPFSLAGDPAKSIYGTTLAGGAIGRGGRAANGTVFSLAPPDRFTQNWSFAVLHAFAATDGAAPRPLVQSATGELYGPTQPGKATARTGTVFQITP